jgi:hypothetical protein
MAKAKLYLEFPFVGVSMEVNSSVTWPAHYIVQIVLWQWKEQVDAVFIG